MVYNQQLDERIQQAMGDWRNTRSKKMFGGVCHLLNGNMVCGVYRDFLILRLGEKAAAAALERSTVHPFDITGRPMKGWVMIAPEGVALEADLNTWLLKARAFVETLPPK